MRAASALLIAMTSSLAGCRAAGDVVVTVPARAVRVDAAVAEAFRVPLDERRQLMNRVVLSSGALRSEPLGDATARALLRDEAHDAWITEFERELVRSDLQVLDRTASEEGADAVLHVHLVEVIEAPLEVDVRAHRLVRRVDGRWEDVETVRVDDFVCRVDARLVLKGGLIAWSGEVEVPATSLAAPGSPRLVFRVEALDPVRVQRLAPGTPDAPNPALAIEWAPIVRDLAPVRGLPEGLAPTPALVRVVARVAARRFVAELLHADLPPGAAPGE